MDADEIDINIPKESLSTDAVEPLPAPTTLATHTRGPRLLKTSRSNSRSSHGSRSSSRGNSRHSSRHSSIARQTREAAVVEPPSDRAGGDEDLWEVQGPTRDANGQPPASTSSDGVLAGPSGSSARPLAGPAPPGVSEDHIEAVELPSLPPRSRPVRIRRRAYSVRDEVEQGPSKRIRRDSDVEIVRPPGEASTSSTLITLASTPPSTSPGGTVVLSSTISPSSIIATSPAAAPVPPAPTLPGTEPLSTHPCPICFSPPTNATITPCGHVCCGECLFTAVRAALQRAQPMMMADPAIPRCPVCRATLKGWDGRGGGVIGLKLKTVYSL